MIGSTGLLQQQLIVMLAKSKSMILLLVTYLDKESLWTIIKLFSTRKEKPRIKLMHSQKQKGSNGCGVFAICFAVAIAFGLNSAQLHLRQEGVRNHLVNCFNKNSFLHFLHDMLIV